MEIIKRFIKKNYSKKSLAECLKRQDILRSKIDSLAKEVEENNSVKYKE